MGMMLPYVRTHSSRKDRSVRRAPAGQQELDARLSDEAHHCYRQKPKDADAEDLKGDDRKEAECDISGDIFVLTWVYPEEK
ncbi:hypothetical protein [Candidatus Accumulibacter contiguus]|jgi:hypothetical protein